jgi:NAD-dependent dihydropyrimidine dehydrogenase PreA subunit
MDVIRMDERAGKAYAKYVEDCMYCGFCIDCPEGAIKIVPGPRLSLTLGWG